MTAPRLTGPSFVARRQACQALPPSVDFRQPLPFELNVGLHTVGDSVLGAEQLCVLLLCAFDVERSNCYVRKPRTLLGVSVLDGGLVHRHLGHCQIRRQKG